MEKEELYDLLVSKIDEVICEDDDSDNVKPLHSLLKEYAVDISFDDLRDEVIHSKYDGDIFLSEDSVVTIEPYNLYVHIRAVRIQGDSWKHIIEDVRG